MKMIVQEECHDPARNLALEQVLLESTEEDLFLLWQNGPSIIIGRNQNPHAEIDTQAVQELGLPVVRRITGGGAVYHDLGNLNFSYIERQAGSHFGDFARYTQPIVHALDQLGLNATLSGRNDLQVQGHKISGNAQRLWQDRMLHHGTLLFDADLDMLGRVLRPSPEKLESKGVASVRARVANLRALLPGLTLEQLIQALLGAFARHGAQRAWLLPEHRRAADTLADARYRSWAWNWAASPPYAWRRRRRLPQGEYEVALEIKGGVIQAASLQGDFMAVLPVSMLTDALVGLRHTQEALLPVLRSLPLAEITGGLSPEELCMLLT